MAVGKAFRLAVFPSALLLAVVTALLLASEWGSDAVDVTALELDALAPYPGDEFL